MTLRFKIDGQQLSRKDKNEIAGFARNYIYAIFDFDKSWIDLYKYALFSEPNGTKHVVSLGYGKELSCKIPQEVLQKAIFYVSVFADDLYTSTQESVLVFSSGYISEIDDMEYGDVIEGDSLIGDRYYHRDDTFPEERRDWFERSEHPYV